VASLWRHVSLIAGISCEVSESHVVAEAGPGSLPSNLLQRKEVVSVPVREKVLLALCIAAFSEAIRLIIRELIPVIVRGLLGF
jgi:hypothetical protein